MSLPDSCLIGTMHRGNNIWKMNLPDYGTVIIKKTVVEGKYSFLDRLGRNLRLYMFNVNLRDAMMAQKAESLGVPTYRPLGVWRVFDHGPACYIMYTYVEGVLLKDLCNNGVIDEHNHDTVLEYVYKIGQIARKLNDGGVRHRDLVPQNLVVRPDGNLAVIDFASGYPIRDRIRSIRELKNFFYLYRVVRQLSPECVYSLCKGYFGSCEDKHFELAMSRLLYWKYMSKTGPMHRMRRWKGLLTAWMMR